MTSDLRQQLLFRQKKERERESHFTAETSRLVRYASVTY